MTYLLYHIIAPKDDLIIPRTIMTNELLNVIIISYRVVFIVVRNMTEHMSAIFDVVA